MGKKTGMLIAACATGAVTFAVGTSSAATRTCGPSSGYTEVARSEKGRVLVKGRPRPGPGGTQLATVAVACRFSDGAVQPLGHLDEDEDMTGMSGFVMAGNRIGYFLRTRIDMGDSGPSDYASIVQDVLGRKNAAFYADPAPESKNFDLEVDSAAQIALGADGAMAWVTCSTSDGSARFPVRCRTTPKAQWAVFGGTLARLRNDDLDPRRLAKGTGKLPTALSVSGGVARFVQAGRRRSARL